MPNEAVTETNVRARLGRKVPEHVYFDGRPLFTAPTAEIAAEVVRLINAGAAIRAIDLTKPVEA
jgi:hypothetical protein